jgi:L-ascorbate metabolism protein UlaG (beta-lactamase superfamily)
LFSATYFGNAAILIDFEKQILIDPGYEKGYPLVDSDQITPSYILITHSHEENLGNAAEFAIEKGTIIVGNPQVIEELTRQKALGYSLEEITPGMDFTIHTNISLTAFKLPHGGFLAPQNTAFLVSSPQGTVLHLGHAKELKNIQVKGSDLLCLPVAGKKMGTMDPKTAADATLGIQPRYVLPISGTPEQVSEFLVYLIQLGCDATPLTPLEGETFIID